jgi:hypothetical protein
MAAGSNVKPSIREVETDVGGPDVVAGICCYPLVSSGLKRHLDAPTGHLLAVDMRRQCTFQVDDMIPSPRRRRNAGTEPDRHAFQSRIQLNETPARGWSTTAAQAKQGDE